MLSSAYKQVAAVVALCVVVAAGREKPLAVDPRAFPTRAVTCDTLLRPAQEPTQIQLCESYSTEYTVVSAKGADERPAAYVDINPEAEKTLLMVHGWPSLWHSWKYQIEEFKVCCTYNVLWKSP